MDGTQRARCRSVRTFPKSAGKCKGHAAFCCMPFALWIHQGLNLGPPDYESGATNQLSYGSVLAVRCRRIGTAAPSGRTKVHKSPRNAKKREFFFRTLSCIRFCRLSGTAAMRSAGTVCRVPLAAMGTEGADGTERKIRIPAFFYRLKALYLCKRKRKIFAANVL